jgi:hypothetical protein
MAVRGSNEWLALCSLLALMAAVLMFAARVLRLGFLADFLSRTVLTGFITGVGVQVALLEVSGMLGLQRTSNDPLRRDRARPAADRGNQSLCGLRLARRADGDHRRQEGFGENSRRTDRCASPPSLPVGR